MAISGYRRWRYRAGEVTATSTAFSVTFGFSELVGIAPEGRDGRDRASQHQKERRDQLQRGDKPA
jgi:hypothetical protein